MAISNDGIHWKKSSNNPIVHIGSKGSWDGVVTKLPSGVIKKENTYYLYYSGRNNHDLKKTQKAIGLATTHNLLGFWKKHKSNPIFKGRKEKWDRHVTTLPSTTIISNGQYQMLYRGMKGFYHDQSLGLAISNNLIHWKRIKQTSKSPSIPTALEIASMSVVQVKNKFIGISQPMKISDRSYWRSHDLISWKKGPTVKFKSSGQVDTISNPFLVNDQWNVLYEQNDRIYRAVLQPPTHTDK